jgi:hypothetical protein
LADTSLARGFGKATQARKPSREHNPTVWPDRGYGDKSALALVVEVAKAGTFLFD